jgi:anaerobic ribonucleoside-triphosphate reductase
MFTKIKKRDGKVVPFALSKIAVAIGKAGKATGEFDENVANSLAEQVLKTASEKISSKIPTVEEIQDIVE